MKKEKANLLIVDDEESILTVLSEYFRSLSYRVYTAENSEEAMKILNANQKIDLLITDIALPGMSGIDLLKISREIRTDVPVIIITGIKALDYAISAIKHGANDYITKPFELTEVRKIVEKVLRYRFNVQKRDKLFQYAKSMNIHFEIPTKEIDAAVVADFLAKFLFTSGFCDHAGYHQLNLAFIETLINAIEHGNLELPSTMKAGEFEINPAFEELRDARMKDAHYGDRKIKISFQFNQQFFSLTITDEGPGFDWKKFFDEKSHPKEMSIESYGRGFLLIRHIIDEVYFNDRGNSITLIKSRSS